MVVDVDKFKGINDTYGHDVGDLVLKRVAEVLQYSFRSTDLVFRLGGDEFVVIMVNVDSSMQEQVRLMAVAPIPFGLTCTNCQLQVKTLW